MSEAQLLYNNFVAKNLPATNVSWWKRFLLTSTDMKYVVSDCYNHFILTFDDESLLILHKNLPQSGTKPDDSSATIWHVEAFNSVADRIAKKQTIIEQYAVPTTIQ